MISPRQLHFLILIKLSLILMFGFTANPKIFVDKLLVYLGLSDYFLETATDETMEGGGKEIAIRQLLYITESKNITIPKDKLIFIGDSIRGDIGSGALFCQMNPEYKGTGILVLKDMDALLSIRSLVNTDEHIRDIVSAIPISAFVIDSTPHLFKL